jgi:uncharacterized beta-barrel protein YwiB (DUF1934 family)
MKCSITAVLSLFLASFATHNTASAQTSSYRVDVIAPSSVYAGNFVYFQLTPKVISGSPGIWTVNSVVLSGTTVQYAVDCRGVDCARDPLGRYYEPITAGPVVLRVFIPANKTPGQYVVTVVTSAGGTTQELAIPLRVLAPPPPLPAVPYLSPTPIPGLSKWESTMTQLAEKWCGANAVYAFSTESQVWYYDGARVFFQIADYTQNKAWEACAFNIARQYRDYVLASNGKLPGWRIFTSGLRMAWERTGDNRYRDAVALLSTNSGFATYTLVISEQTIREVAYIINAHVDAEKMGLPRYPHLARTVDALIGQFDRLFVAKTYDSHQTFMDGLAAEALINYYELTRDPRVPPTIKLMLDWMWDYGWIKSQYQLIINPEPLGPKCGWGCQQGNTDLINLTVPAFAWYWSVTGDPVYQQRGDEMFAHSLDSDISYSGKIFSQNYKWSPAYVSWRRSSGTSTTCSSEASASGAATIISSISDGQLLSGTVNVSADPTDSRCIAGVQFILDGQAYGEEDTAPAFITAIDTLALTNTSHTIAARARETAGTVTMSPAVTFTVRNGADTVAPTVAITSPTASQTVKGTIEATVNVTDAQGVAGVQFVLDGQIVGLEDTTAPFTLSINTTRLTNTTHKIAARARDAAGNIGISPIVSFVVNNTVGSTSPTVAITSPSASQTVSGTITAAANATDSAGVAGVQFLVDGQPYGVEDTTAPYTVSINTTTLTNTTHTIAARARNSTGSIGTSSNVNFIVANTTTTTTADKTAPTVAIVSPTNNQTVTGTVTASANATDAQGVVGVQFVLDGAFYGAEDTTAPYTVSINTASLTNTTHRIAARARDAAGNIGTSYNVNFIVATTTTTTDTTAPTVAIVSPASNQTVTGTITASANATDAKGVVGVQFVLDGALYGVEDTTAPYTVSINTASLTNTTHRIAARARDAAGNIGASYNVNFVVANATTTADTTAPTVAMVSPTNNQTVTGTITASANATDGKGVVGVQFVLDGAFYGAEDTTAPYTVSINTASLTKTTHRVAARARDAAGNVGTSSIMSFIVN